jgi:hypothetical protein
MLFLVLFSLERMPLSPSLRRMPFLVLEERKRMLCLVPSESKRCPLPSSELDVVQREAGRLKSQ